MKARLSAAAAIGCWMIALGVVADAQQHEPGHTIVTPDAVTWGPAPPALPPGAQVAVLEGDPSKAGPFTMRARFPDGYTVPPHSHPADEHVTVLQGTLNMGLGETLDKSAAKAMSSGSFAIMKKGTRHFAFAKGETVIQIHGVGPWDINYVNPSDDPRKKASE